MVKFIVLVNPVLTRNILALYGEAGKQWLQGLPLFLERLAAQLGRNLASLLDLTAFNRERVLSWCIIQALASVCWYVEDNMLDKAKQLVAYAERLYSLN